MVCSVVARGVLGEREGGERRRPTRAFGSHGRTARRAREERDERGISHHQNNIMTLPAKMDQVVVVERKPEDATATTTEPVTPVSHKSAKPNGMKVELSPLASRPKNRIRIFVEGLLQSARREGEPDSKTGEPLPKRLDLSLGDPTALGLAPPAEAEDAVVSAVKDGLMTTKQVHGYQHSCGSPAFREAICEEISPGVSPDSVFVTSGCSQALQFALTALAKEGSNVLVPNPCFPLYNTICEHVGAEARSYSLLPERGWEACLRDLDAKLDDNTCCLLVCNPGNPTSHSYSQDHLCDLLRFAYDKRIPVVADEVYAHMTYDPRADERSTFQWMADVASQQLGRNRPPVLSCSALSKRFLVPGWRCGWLALHDDAGRSLVQAGISNGIAALCQIGMTTNSMAQAAAPLVLRNTPQSYHDSLNETMRKGAAYCLERISKCEGLECPSEPSGAMYMFFRVPEARGRADGEGGDSSDVVFCRDLLSEKNVFTLPGFLFGSPNFVRVVSAAPMAVLEEAWDRIEDFCKGRSD